MFLATCGKQNCFRIKKTIFRFPKQGDFTKFGAIISKGAKRGDYKTLKLTLHILELQMKSKKGFRCFLMVVF